MIVNLFATFQNYTFRKCEAFTNTKHWMLTLTLLLPIVVLFFSFPSYERLSMANVGGWNAVLNQAAHPFTPSGHADWSHADKLTFRLVMPIIAHIFSAGIVGILFIQAFFGVMLFHVAIRLFRKISQDNITSLLLAFSLAFIYAGRVSFTEIRGIFDGVALFFMICSLYFNNPVLIFTSVFLGAWSDERALIASSLVFLFWVLSENKLVNNRTIAVVLAWIAYFVVRYLLTITFGFRTSTAGTGLYILTQQINNYPLGLWSAFEGNWLLISASVVILFRQKRFVFLGSYLMSIFIIILVAFAVVDITRSMSYMIPALFISLLLIKKVEHKRTMQKIVFVATMISFIYPAYYTAGDYYNIWNYPFPLQILRYFFGAGTDLMQG